MPAAKGNNYNPKGRGSTPGKVGKEVKDSIRMFVEHNFEGVQENYDKLKPNEKLLFLEKMIAYIVPKQKEHTGEGGAPLFPSDAIRLELHRTDANPVMYDEPAEDKGE